MPGAGQTTIYASWNGATEVKTWQVLAVNAAGVLPVPDAAKSGFETAMTVTGPGRFFQAKALDAHGTVLGVSAVTLLPLRDVLPYPAKTGHREVRRPSTKRMARHRANGAACRAGW